MPDILQYNKGTFNFSVSDKNSNYVKGCNTKLHIYLWNEAAEIHFHCKITTYLCYSPTCTPAQLSLLSEAIAKYSAFLEGKERKKKWL